MGLGMRRSAGWLSGVEPCRAHREDALSTLRVRSKGDVAGSCGKNISPDGPTTVGRRVDGDALCQLARARAVWPDSAPLRADAATTRLRPSRFALIRALIGRVFAARVQPR